MYNIPAKALVPTKEKVTASNAAMSVRIDIMRGLLLAMFFYPIFQLSRLDKPCEGFDPFEPKFITHRQI
jgi:hypothetical protein